MEYLGVSFRFLLVYLCVSRLNPRSLSLNHPGNYVIIQSLSNLDIEEVSGQFFIKEKIAHGPEMVSEGVGQTGDIFCISVEIANAKTPDN